MKKFKNKYRIPSARHPNWDYHNHALYFVTICTDKRRHFSGKISNGIMILSNIGKIVQSEWLKTFEIRPDMNLTKYEHIIMPNHFHAIIGVGKNKYNDTGRDAMPCVSLDNYNKNNKDAMPCVSLDNINNKNNKKDAKHCVSTFGPQSKNLASIVRGFKTGVTHNARKLNPIFKWQARFHDHIIKNKKSFQNISNYIINNPRNWTADVFHNNK